LGRFLGKFLRKKIKAVLAFRVLIISFLIF
jgi:hypothetical protein